MPYDDDYKATDWPSNGHGHAETIAFIGYKRETIILDT